MEVARSSCQRIADQIHTARRCDQASILSTHDGVQLQVTKQKALIGRPRKETWQFDRAEHVANQAGTRIYDTRQGRAGSKLLAKMLWFISLFQVKLPWKETWCFIGLLIWICKAS